MTNITLVNGKPVSVLSAADRGLHYGDGVFETILVAKQRPILLDLHIQRLQHGCEALKIQQVDFNQIRKQLESVASECLERGVLKLIISRGEGLGGYALQHTRGAETSVIRLTSIDSTTNKNALDGVELYLCQYRLPHNHVLAGIKHLNRLDQVMARSEWNDEFAEGLMLDCEDFVIEGTMTNLFVEKECQLFTPDLSHCGVAGVMREYILQQTQSLGINCTVKQITMQDLKDADGLFVCNSVRGIWPVTMLADTRYSITEMTRSLQKHIAQWYPA